MNYKKNYFLTEIFMKILYFFKSLFIYICSVNALLKHYKIAMKTAVKFVFIFKNTFFRFTTQVVRQR
jgi:hypothetical protein